MSPDEKLLATWNVALAILIIGIIALFVLAFITNAVLERMERKNAKPRVYSDLRETWEYNPHKTHEENEEVLTRVYRKTECGYVRI